MTTYAVRTPADLIALTPYLLGFHPEDSVVLLTFGAGERFHARVDLPLDPEAQETVARRLCAVIITHHVERVAVLLYSDHAAVAGAQAELLVAGLVAAGVEVVDVIRVDAECYYPVPDPDTGGTAYDLSTHPFTAAQIFEGRLAQHSRAALADSLVGGDEEDASAVRLAAEDCADRILERGRGRGEPLSSLWLPEQGRWIQARIQRYLRDGRPLTPEDAARMLVLVSLVCLRDVAWSEMSRSTARRQVQLWGDLVRRSPRDLLPAAAALLGFAAWLAGDGALAWCAVDRCFEIDPDHPMGRLLAQGLEQAVPPSTWSPIPAEQLPVFADRGAERRAG